MAGGWSKIGLSAYNIFMKRNSTFFVTVAASAIFVETGLNAIVESAWDRANKGKQWKDIKSIATK